MKNLIQFAFGVKKILKDFYFIFKWLLRKCLPLQHLFWQACKLPVIKSMMVPDSPTNIQKYHNHKLPSLFECLLCAQHWCQGKSQKKWGGLYHQGSYSWLMGHDHPHKMIMKKNYTNIHHIQNGLENLSWVYEGIEVPLVPGEWTRFG